MDKTESKKWILKAVAWVIVGVVIGALLMYFRADLGFGSLIPDHNDDAGKEYRAALQNENEHLLSELDKERAENDSTAVAHEQERIDWEADRMNYEKSISEKYEKVRLDQRNLSDDEHLQLFTKWVPAEK